MKNKLINLILKNIDNMVIISGLNVRSLDKGKKKMDRMTILELKDFYENVTPNFDENGFECDFSTLIKEGSEQEYANIIK